MASVASNIVVLGQGAFSNALAQLFRCPQISRNANDSDWDWPTKRFGDFVSFIIVVGATLSVSRIMRWHSDAWRCPKLRQARCAIFVVGATSPFELCGRDVFGRTGEHGESFSDWAQHIAVILVSEGFCDFLDRITTLTYCPVKTWKRKDEEAAVIPALHTAIRSHDRPQLLQIVRRANQQDWDAVCHPHPSFGDPHRYANHIRKWLRSVTSNVTPNWDEGEALISPLAKNNTEPCNST